MAARSEPSFVPRTAPAACSPATCSVASCCIPRATAHQGRLSRHRLRESVTIWKISSGDASLMRMPEDNGGLAPAYSRYRALLDVSAALVEQPTVKAVLHSLREVLSSSVRLHGADLYLLNSGRETLHLLEFDRAADAPAIRIGTKISRIGAAAQALEQQEPVFLPDVSQEMLKHPELAPFAAQSAGRSTYIFPVFTAQQQFGVLAVTKERGQEFAREDVELLRSLTSHVAIALECALARDCAEQYQRELATERDRLRLLLEINNYVVSKLNMEDLFRSASASIRSYFGNHLTGFWLLEKDSTRLQSVMLDFPDRKVLLAEVGSTDLTETDYEKLRTRRSEIWSVDDIERLPTTIAGTLRAESITSVAVAPLATGSGPLGVLAIGSRKLDAFGQVDLDLLTQISIQISLALDNARLTTSQRLCGVLPDWKHLHELVSGSFVTRYVTIAEVKP